MFERPKAGENALLVAIQPDAPPDAEVLSEFRALSESAGANIAGLFSGARRQPDPQLYIGRGKADEIKAAIADTGAELVIFNNALSPAQERNLERHFECRVLDRTGLILDIFAQRARSFEGKLQVELAQLKHLSTRLIRGWTHLERQKGGIGLRGPGETQLETDRRLINTRIARIHRRLEKVGSQREQGRRSRGKADIPTVSLVGYTNAGKSTLFNAITGAEVYVRDQLFATLDPTLRRLPLGNGAEALLADTVGFVADLPHELVAAFRSTLQETVSARLLLHVIDAAGANRDACIAEVDRVIAQIGADQVRQIQVYNKIDLLDDPRPRIERDAQGEIRRVWLSAHSGEGLDLLLRAIEELCFPEQLRRRFQVPLREGRLRALLYANGKVLAERRQGEDWLLDVSLSRANLQRLLKLYPALHGQAPSKRFR